MNQAETFFSLHRRDRPLVLCNAWDAYSARLFESMGFEAVASSSAGQANALGYADGEGVDLDELFAALRRIVRVVRVPVSADLEAGFGIGTADAVRTLERALDAGIVGGNFEDYDPKADALLPIDVQCERIRALKGRSQALGKQFFVNARTDIVLREVGDMATRIDRTIERLKAYAEAGADGVFVPGAMEASAIRQIAAAVDRPLNVLGGPAMPPVAELGRLGVARVSVGSWPARVAMGAAQHAAAELRDHGTFEFTTGAVLGYDESNELFTRR